MLSKRECVESFSLSLEVDHYNDIEDTVEISMRSLDQTFWISSKIAIDLGDQAITDEEVCEELIKMWSCRYTRLGWPRGAAEQYRCKSEDPEKDIHIRRYGKYCIIEKEPSIRSNPLYHLGFSTVKPVTPKKELQKACVAVLTLEDIKELMETHEALKAERKRRDNCSDLWKTILKCAYKYGNEPIEITRCIT